MKDGIRARGFKSAPKVEAGLDNPGPGVGVMRVFHFAAIQCSMRQRHDANLPSCEFRMLSSALRVVNEALTWTYARVHLSRLVLRVDPSTLCVLFLARL